MLTTALDSNDLPHLSHSYKLLLLQDLRNRKEGEEAKEDQEGKQKEGEAKQRVQRGKQTEILK